MMLRSAKINKCDIAELFNSTNRIIVMGVVNATPDSFSDGGLYQEPSKAVAQARRLIGEGADIIDVGGESSRPGSDPVSEREEMARVIPVVEQLAGNCSVPVSVDTWKSKVAHAALQAGAAIINDITALNGDPDMASTVANFGAGLILMHKRGAPKVMQADTRYENLIAEITAYLQAAIARAEGEGVNPRQIMVDPGIGFGKDVEGNLLILRFLDRLRELGKPVMIGASRKSFISKISLAETDDRLGGSIAAAVTAVLNGAVAVRVHDVRETRQAVDLALRLRKKQ